MRVTTDDEIGRGHGKAVTLQPIYFLNQDRRVQDHPVSDHADLAGVENSRRNQMKDELSSSDHKGVTGVVASLKTDYAIRLFRQQVDDFSLPLHPPIESR